jgi:hypothetical protein
VWLWRSCQLVACSIWVDLRHPWSTTRLARTIYQSTRGVQEIFRQTVECGACDAPRHGREIACLLSTAARRPLGEPHPDRYPEPFGRGGAAHESVSSWSARGLARRFVEARWSVRATRKEFRQARKDAPRCPGFPAGF